MEVPAARKYFFAWHRKLIKLAVSTQAEGNAFTDDRTIEIDSSGVVIDGNAAYHAGNFEIETGSAAESTTGQMQTFGTAFSQTPVLVVTPKSANSRGLKEADGKYKKLIKVFNLDKNDYHRFMRFLHEQALRPEEK